MFCTKCEADGGASVRRKRSASLRTARGQIASASFSGRRRFKGTATFFSSFFHSRSATTAQWTTGNIATAAPRHSIDTTFAIGVALAHTEENYLGPSDLQMRHLRLLLTRSLLSHPKQYPLGKTCSIKPRKPL